jgi:hypothetical protein
MPNRVEDLFKLKDDFEVIFPVQRRYFSFEMRKRDFDGGEEHNYDF